MGFHCLSYYLCNVSRATNTIPIMEVWGRIQAFVRERRFSFEKTASCLTAVRSCDKPLAHDPYGQMARGLATVLDGVGPLTVTSPS
jgi:hypothetical protein